MKNSQMTLRHWFYRNARRPLAYAAIILLGVQLTAAVFFLMGTITQWNEMADRFTDTVTLGILQENRTLLETAFSALASNEQVNNIALCRESIAAMALPPGYDSCRKEPGFSMTSFFAERGLPNAAGFRVIIEFHLLKALAPMLQLMALTLVFYFIAFGILWRAQRRLQTDLLMPLSLPIEDNEETRTRMQTMKIQELRQLFENTIAKIEAFKCLNEEKSRHERTAAIADTVQMLAHDVRKPFTMIQMLLDLLNETNDLPHLKEVLATFGPGVRNATISVNRMIEDLMNAEGNIHLFREPICIENFFKRVLDDLKVVHPSWRGKVITAFKHTGLIHLDVGKMERVIGNILSNAVEAAPNGDIILTSEERESVTAFSIMNTGSHIPPSEIPQIFDRFFTSGKKNGTGLGLAVAKKIMSAHGGQIQCVSEKNERYPDGMVQFNLNLPR